MQNLIETTKRTRVFSLHAVTFMLWNFVCQLNASQGDLAGPLPG